MRMDKGKEKVVEMEKVEEKEDEEDEDEEEEEVGIVSQEGTHGNGSKKLKRSTHSG